jgi:putative transposase
VHDVKLLEATIKAIVVDWPEPDSHPQNLCLDKGYDGRTARLAAEAARYIPQIRRKGEEKLDTRGKKRYPARRWVVERTLAWLQKCRAILIRYDKKALVDGGEQLDLAVEHDREVLERVVRVSDKMRLVW